VTQIQCKCPNGNGHLNAHQLHPAQATTISKAQHLNVNLLFNCEDGGSKFLHNVCKDLPEITFQNIVIFTLEVVQTAESEYEITKFI
jgi:hypothetical protein